MRKVVASASMSLHRSIAETSATVRHRFDGFDNGDNVLPVHYR